MRRSRGGNRGSRPPPHPPPPPPHPPEKSQKYRVPFGNVPDPLKNHKAIKPASNVPMMAWFCGSWIHWDRQLKKTKHCQCWTPSEKTFWIRAWGRQEMRIYDFMYYAFIKRGKSAYITKKKILFLNQNICCWYTKHMLEMIYKLYAEKNYSSKPVCLFRFVPSLIVDSWNQPTDQINCIFLLNLIYHVAIRSGINCCCHDLICCGG